MVPGQRVWVLTAVDAVGVGNNLIIYRGDLVPSEVPAGGLVYNVQHRHVARIAVCLQQPDYGLPVL